jgi:hypothetical protein
VARQRHGVTTLTSETLANHDPKRNQAPLPGSLGDLVTQAQGRPIYCTPSLAVRRALMNVIVGSFHRDFPAAVFLDALTIYRNHDDWSRRWYSEHERYGAGIVVTRAEDLPESTDPFTGLAGVAPSLTRAGMTFCSSCLSKRASVSTKAVVALRRLPRRCGR